MFLHVCVILFTGEGVSGQAPLRTWQGEPPRPGRENPPGRQTPLGPGRENPPRPGRENPHPPDQADPPRPGRPPQDLAGRTPPPREEDCSIRSMSSRYASYWNAFLFDYVHVAKV